YKLLKNGYKNSLEFKNGGTQNIFSIFLLNIRKYCILLVTLASFFLDRNLWGGGYNKDGFFAKFCIYVVIQFSINCGNVGAF
ncbi:MAG: hypothetical protein NC325_06980, partial [Anaeroplasma bactoclasticum]|nr:hypothetical protein [Anaeroplasma bactoclasticum]